MFPSSSLGARRRYKVRKARGAFLSGGVPNNFPSEDAKPAAAEAAWMKSGGKVGANSDSNTQSYQRVGSNGPKTSID